MAENNSNNPRHLYESLKKGNKDKVMAAYEKTRSDDERLKLIPTVHDDTILHLAIYMGQQDIAKAIVRSCARGGDSLIMKRNALGNTVLHEAAATNMKSLIAELLTTAPTLLSMPNEQQEMPLYTAAHYGQTDVFTLLAKGVDKHHSADLDRHLRPNGMNPRKARTTILHAATHAEFFELAFLIAKRYPQLVNQEDEKRMTGLQLLSSNPSAFKSSGTKYGPIKKFLYYCAPHENAVIDHGFKEEDVDDRIYSDSSDDETKAFFKLPQCQTCPLLSMKLLYTISSVNRSVWNILRAWGPMKKIYGEKKRHVSAFELAKLLIVADFTWDCIGGRDERENVTASTNAPPADPTAGIESREFEAAADDGNQIKGLGSGTDRIGPSGEVTAPSMAHVHSPLTPLLLATSHGILEIVEEILRVYPLAVEHVSEMGQNILHVAIEHRQSEIFDQVTKMESPKSRLVRQIDCKGFTILHQVGNMKFHNGGTQPGPTLQLQEELIWFENVKQMIPPHYAMHLAWTEEEKGKNEEQRKKKEKEKTPKDYFRQTHGKLLKEAQEWLKRTSESCSTVAGLMATVAFAAAFTVPGGNNDNGLPVLLDHPFFLVFVVTDALSLASSLTSLVMFLSILTSPFELHDFRYSLPRKPILGFTFLFFSVAVTMLAFASTLMLTITIKKRLTASFIYFVAFLPVTIFALLQFPLYVAFTTSVKYSFQAIKSVLPWHLISTAFSKTKCQ